MIARAFPLDRIELYHWRWASIEQTLTEGREPPTERAPRDDTPRQVTKEDMRARARAEPHLSLSEVFESADASVYQAACRFGAEGIV